MAHGCHETAVYTVRPCRREREAADRPRRRKGGSAGGAARKPEAGPGHETVRGTPLSGPDRGGAGTRCGTHRAVHGAPRQGRRLRESDVEGAGRDGPYRKRCITFSMFGCYVFQPPSRMRWRHFPVGDQSSAPQTSARSREAASSAAACGAGPPAKPGQPLQWRRTSCASASRCAGASFSAGT